MVDQKKAYRYGLVAVLLWSTVASAFKLSLRHLNFIELLFFSDITSCFVLAVFLWRIRKFKELFQCSGKQYFMSFLLGLLNPFSYYLLLFKAYDLLPAQEAQTLNYTWALTLALLALLLLGQTVRLSNFIGLITGYFGAVIIATGGNLLHFSFTEPVGVGLALGSTVIWALYWIYNIMDPRHPAVLLFLNFIFSIIPTTTCYLFFTGFRIPSAAGMIGSVYIGIFEMSVTYLIWLSALRYSEDTAKVSGLIYLSPFISLIMIHFIVGEMIKITTILGLVLIVIGIMVQKKRL
jgi:drug/metabolite transporter (DMT)-like permease